MAEPLYSVHHSVAMTTHSRDTISAISTPPGEGGIGIVRISGPAALATARRIFGAPAGPLPPTVPTHTIRFGWVNDPGSRDRIDEVLLLYMQAPHSYTGEDVVELQGHGGITVTAAVLEATIKAGCRLAEPGEFTRRAFLNGRMDLSRAEAVVDLIRSRTDVGRKVALSGILGLLSSRMTRLRDGLLSLVAEVEASLDFDEDEVVSISLEQMGRSLDDLILDLQDTLAKAGEGAVYLEGVKVVIAGGPNVGKSSLFNALLEEERAIVTPHPGTTRDSIEAWLNLKGIPVTLVDGAGIREAACDVEREGVRRSVRQISSSTVAILVLDSSQELVDEADPIFDLLRGKPFLVALNKSDLPPRFSMDEVKKILPDVPMIGISCLLRQGIEELKSTLYGLAAGNREPAETLPIASNLRQRDALRRALDRLQAARIAAAGRQTLDAVAVDLRQALDAVGEITGETATEDILNQVFSRFCIGK